MLKQALDDAHAGKFQVIVVWALDRINREGAEGPLWLIRQFKHRGCILVSVKESWLNAAPEVQDVLVAFAGWMARQESRRRSERIKAGLDRRRAQGKPVGRQPGAADKKPRNAAATSHPGRTDDAAPPTRPGQHHRKPTAMTGARETSAAELAAPLDPMTIGRGRQTKPSLAQTGTCHKG